MSNNFDSNCLPPQRSSRPDNQAFLHEETEGLKFDAGKPIFTCLDAESILEVGKVAAFGAKKYSYDNWRLVVDGERRYLNALWRHLLAHQSGEFRDQETGLPHLAHAGWNALAALFFARKEHSND